MRSLSLNYNNIYQPAGDLQRLAPGRYIKGNGKLRINKHELFKLAID